MQTLSAYLLETDGLAVAELELRAKQITAHIAEWLHAKGAVAVDPTLATGVFQSRTADGDGRFAREQFRSDRGRLEQVKLEEFSRGGQTFATRITVGVWDNKLFIHSMLTVSNTVSVLAPVATDPRCPSIIRTLIDAFSDWKLSGGPAAPPRPRLLLGASGGNELVAELQSATRALPVIVVSQNEGETLWPRLAENLAYDLAGLAHVVAIDDEATWALTDALGKMQSCYRGAVRLYWPSLRQKIGEKLLNSTVWTSSTLLSNDRDGKGMDRFRTTLRRLVMSIAAMTITPPIAIREIQAAAARKRLEDIEARSTSNTEELEIARLYLSDNEELKIQLEHATEEIARLSGRAEAAEFALGQVKVRAEEEEPPEAAPEAEAPPTAGETRFYKRRTANKHMTC